MAIKRIIIFLLIWCFSSRAVVAASASCGSATCEDATNTHGMDVAQMLQHDISVYKPSSSQLLQGERDENITTGIGAANVENISVYKPSSSQLLQGSRSQGSEQDNIELGFGAGESVTSGSYNNIFIGNNAGQSETNGDENIYIGTNSGQAGTTGKRNTLVGTYTGQSQEGAHDSTFVGYSAGMANTASDNTFIGSFAGTANTQGVDNTFIGEEAGKSNVDGKQNVFVGEDAGYDNTEGTGNVAVGVWSFNKNTEGTDNVAIGEEAGMDITSNNNVAVGAHAGEDISSGQGNTMVGAHAGTNTDFDSCNTFIGYQAGWDNGRTNTGNAQANTYLGFAAGMTNRAGANNVILGAFSDSSTIDSSDTALEASFSSATVWQHGDLDRSSGDTTIQSVTAIGSSIVIKGNHGVSVGTQSTVTKKGGIAIGAEASVTGEESITIGRYSSVAATNSIAIGTSATVTTDNSMALGGVGDGRVSVGIGTSSPNSLASLELADTDKGFLPNRMTTTQRNSLVLSTTEAGMMVYDKDEEKLYMWNGQMGAWSAQQNGDSGTSSNGGLISGMALSGQTLALAEAGTTHSVDLSSLVNDADADSTNELITAIALNGQELVITEAGNSNSVDLSSLVTAADADVDNTNELITGMFLNGQSLEITETVCDTFTAGYSCRDVVGDTGRLTDGETGPDADCLTACKAAGYTCCRRNYDLSPVRCHGGTTGMVQTTNQNHHSAMVCQTGIIKSVDLSSLVNDADADTANELITNVALNGQSLEITEGGVTHHVDMSGLTLAQTSLAQVDMYGLVKQLQTQIAEVQAKSDTQIEELQATNKKLEAKNEELEQRLQKIER